MSFLAKRNESRRKEASPREIEVVTRQAEPPPPDTYTASPRPARKEGVVSVEDLLKSAAIMGDQPMLQRLLQEGLPVNCRDEIGNSPLHHCCEHGYLPLVRLLLDHHASVTMENQSLITPLHVAALNGHHETIALLLKHAAPIDHADVGGMTALHWAVTKGHKLACKTLLREGAHANLPDVGGSTPLSIAVARGKESFVQLLLKHKASVQVDSRTDGQSPLHLACSSNRLTMAAILIDHNADCNATDVGGNTPLHVAARHGTLPLVQFLLDSNADPDHENSQGKLPYDCTGDENIRHALRLREIYIDEEEFCLVERDRHPPAPHKRHPKKVQVLEARDDSDKSSIVEQFGHSVKGQYILVLDGAEGAGAAGLQQRPWVNKDMALVDNDIVCPVIVSRLSRARPRLRKFARLLASKIPAVDVASELPFFRQSAPDLNGVGSARAGGDPLRSSDPSSGRYRSMGDVSHAGREEDAQEMPRGGRELAASVGREPRGLGAGGMAVPAPAPFDMAPDAFRPYCNLDPPPSLPLEDDGEEEEEEDLAVEGGSSFSPFSSGVLNPYTALQESGELSSLSPPWPPPSSPSSSVASSPSSSLPSTPEPAPVQGYENTDSLAQLLSPSPSLALSSPRSPDSSPGTDMRLVKLLQDLELSKYIEVFLAEEWDWDSLLEITNSDLIDMGIKAGSRRKLLSAIARVRAGLHADPHHHHHPGRSSVHSSLLSLASQENSHSQRTRTEELIEQCSYIVDYREITVRSHLGKGFYGSVYLGTWNGVDVAIKEVSQPLESIEKWVMEVELLHKLRHPNIVMFYCACVKAPNYCIVLEYAARGSLEAVLQGLVVDLEHSRRLSILCDIARGLKYLHAQQPPIIHRDLKSDNVLIDANWVAKVSDLGLSRYKDSTYSYGKANSPFDVTIAAAEVLQDNHISEKADVYSFSLIMWELYTRRRPYRNMNPRWVAEQVIHGHMRPSMQDTDHWEPAYVSLMKRCWSEHYKDRPFFPEILTALENMMSAAVRANEALSSGTSANQTLGYVEEYTDPGPE